MFKIPDWEDDIPKVNLSFPKKAKTNNKRNKNLLEANKSNVVIKPILKAKNKLGHKFKLVKKKENTFTNKTANPIEVNIISENEKMVPNIQNDSSKVEKVSKVKKNNEANDVIGNKNDDKLYDTDKLDELILNEKKQKLNSYKKDDIEEILFNDINLVNIKIENSKVENNENNDKIKEKKKIKQLLSGNKIVTTTEDKKKGVLKSKLQKRNGSRFENEKVKVVHQLENKILKTKDERRKKVPKSITLQNGSKNNLEREKLKEPHQLENQNLISNDESKKKVQKSILLNGNNNNSKKNINMGINPLSGGHKIIKIKDNKKKEALKAVLQIESHRNSINVSGNKLRVRMLERLKAAQFRYLNEKLYTSSGSDAKQLFQEDPEAFQTYHKGYQQQVKRWPVKPLDVIVKRIQKMPRTHLIADMGCGEADLSTRVAQPVRSFDLVACKPIVETCDMAHTPLLSNSMDVAVYCLALMGTDLTQYLVEANRILKIGGILLIAEVESRFHDLESFTRDIQKLGFTHKKTDKSQTVFFFMEFTKVREPPLKKAKLPVLSLKPCIYKKR